MLFQKSDAKGGLLLCLILYSPLHILSTALLPLCPYKGIASSHTDAYHLTLLGLLSNSWLTAFAGEDWGKNPTPQKQTNKQKTSYFYQLIKERNCFFDEL